MKICKCGGPKSFGSKVCRPCRNRILKDPKQNSNYKHGHSIKKNGQTKVYMVWNQMLKRCTVKNHKQYSYYGGRGIKVIKKWFVFENFLKDMGEPLKNMKLDRVNNNGNYCKSNCRWAYSQQSNLNRREIFKNKTSKYKGVYWHKKMKKWCSSITFNKKKYDAGSFFTEKEARSAYLKLRNKLWN